MRAVSGAVFEAIPECIDGQSGPPIHCHVNGFATASVEYRKDVVSLVTFQCQPDV